MPFILYDTYSKGDRPFEPLVAGKVGMYTCGPTVYGRPHIGNYSSFLMADLLRRWLEAGHGYQVTHVKNITDVGHLVADQDTGEDKIEKQAKAENIDPLAIARKYTQQYLEDEKALNMLEPSARPRATETIPEMIAIIEELLLRGHAYETEDGVYFAVETFPKYGQLSGNTLDKLSAGSRVDVDEKKKHPADFALWKKTVGANAHHLLKWPSPWGEGFPGWHIECSAMSRKLLGSTFDIHTGGEDNIFPHHECEIAQSEGSTEEQFVRYWLHKRRIDLGSEKMSKSLGNVLTLPDIVEKGYDPGDLRYYLLCVHYRTNLKFTWKGMDDAKKSRAKITEWMAEAERDLSEKNFGTRDASAKEDSLMFRESMDSDLNTSAALSHVFASMNDFYKFRPFSEASLKDLQQFITLIRDTFGCFEAQETAIPANVQSLLQERAQARTAKDFAASDRLRDEIAALGYTVKDTAEGQQVRKS